LSTLGLDAAHSSKYLAVTEGWFVQVTSTFDSGNIKVLDASQVSSATLEIRPDAGGDHFQWFHFRVTGARDQATTLHITNAAKCSYPDAWNGYQAAASYDREAWFRVPTSYEDGTLTIRHTPDFDSVYYAYFAPFSHEQHLDLLSSCQLVEGVSLELLGQTVDGRDLELLRFGNGPRQVWVIARQHPGESMAEWWMQGFLARILDEDDALGRKLQSLATFHVVPNMNPDGSSRGHLRNNATGANLNREWHEPTMVRSPEVKLVRDRMDVTGVDLCLDVHGDEELPYNFVSGAEGIPSWTDRMADLQRRFCEQLMASNPDFQMTFGYGVDEPGSANMTMCTNQVAERYACLAMTLEQPFKDTADTPHPDQGWSPERAQALGASALDALAVVVHDLR
jgi:murein tripeptide amidase MpaA